MQHDDELDDVQPSGVHVFSIGEDKAPPQLLPDGNGAYIENPKFYEWLEHAKNPPKDGPQPIRLSARKVSDIAAEEVGWMWPGRIARAKLNIIESDPGTGKGLLTMALAAHITGGRLIPGVPIGDPASVIYVQYEDGASDTIRPRADAAGVVLERFWHVDRVQEGEEDRPLTLPDDIHVLDVMAKETGAEYMVVDPLGAAISGKTDSHNEAQIRRMLAPVAGWAEMRGVTVIVVRHLVKAGGRNAITSGGGSIGIVGAARVALRVDLAPEALGLGEDARILSLVKNNLTKKPSSVAFRIVQTPGDLAAHVEWLGDVDVSADEMAAERDAQVTTTRTQQDEASDAIREILRSGEMPSGEVLQATRRCGIADRTAQRAARKIGVIHTRRGVGKDHAVYWSLGASDATPATPTAHINTGVSGGSRIERDNSLSLSLNGGSAPLLAPLSPLLPHGRELAGVVRMPDGSQALTPERIAELRAQKRARAQS